MNHETATALSVDRFHESGVVPAKHTGFMKPGSFPPSEPASSNRTRSRPTAPKIRESGSVSSNRVENFCKRNSFMKPVGPREFQTFLVIFPEWEATSYNWFQEFMKVCENGFMKPVSLSETRRCELGWGVGGKFRKRTPPPDLGRSQRLQGQIWWGAPR